MHRKKRNLRLKSIVFKIGSCVQTFDFDMNEELRCTSKEKAEMIKNIQIQVKIYNQNRTNGGISNNIEFPQVNAEKAEKLNESITSIEKNNEGIIIDLVNDKSAELNQKNKNFSFHISDSAKVPPFKERKKSKKSIFTDNIEKIMDNLKSKSIYNVSEDLLCFSDEDDDCMYQNNEDFNYF